MARTVVAGKYTIVHKEAAYFDEWEVTERDAFRGGPLVGTDVSTVRCGFERDEIDELTNREIIDDALFGQWTFGYPYVGVGEGELYCHDCTVSLLADMSDDPDMVSEDEWITVTVLQELQPAGEYCPGCESYAISEPYCQECSSQEKPLLFAQEGYHAICRDCMAEALMKREATRKVKTYAASYMHPDGETYVQYRHDNGGTFTYERSA